MSANTNNIQKLYVAYFGRPADASGLAYWETVVGAANGSTTAVSAAFAASAEYKATFSGLNNDQIVNTIYNNLFHRDAEVSGLLYWSNLLTKGSITIDNVVTQISNAALGTDAIAFAEKVAASVAFTAALDTTQEILSYNGPSAVAIAKTWLAGVYDVASEHAAEASLGATVASLENIVNVHSVSLTTGIDYVTSENVAVLGTALDSEGGVVYTTQTFTPGDQITPTGTHNSLTLSTSDTNGIWYSTLVPAGVTVSNVQTVTLSAPEAVYADTENSVMGFSGLTTLNVNSVSSSSDVDDITAAATTAIKVSDVVVGDLSSSTGHGLTVNGGSTVTITEANGKHAGSNTIVVNGGSGTSAVTVNQTEAYGYKSQAVEIYDLHSDENAVAGTITTVTLGGLANNNAVIESDALSSLTVNNSDDAAVTIHNFGANTNSASALNLTLNNDGTVNGLMLVDHDNAYTTLNVTTGAIGSNLSLADFTKITAETITGSSLLAQATSGGHSGDNLSALKTITVSGNAGFVSALDEAPKLTSVTSTSTGLVGVTLNAQQTSFTGGAGRDIVVINSDATKAITAGTATNNEIVLNASATSFSAAFTGANVTNFTTLGVADRSAGTYALSGTGALFSGIKAVDVAMDTAGAVTFTGAAKGTTLTFDGFGGTHSDGNAQDVTFKTADTTGATDTLNLTLGISEADLTALGSSLVFDAAATQGFQAAHHLTLSDANNAGLATVNVVSNATNVAGDAYNSIGTLYDAGLSSLTVSGTGDLQIWNTLMLNGVSTLTLTDNSTSAYGLTFHDGITDTALTTLNIAGTNSNAAGDNGSFDIGTLNVGAQTSLTVHDTFAGDVVIGTLQAVSATTETFTNTGAGVIYVGQGGNTATALTTLNLTGEIAYSASADAVSKGITINGAADNADVVFATTSGGGALSASISGSSTYTDTITLGNGDNTVTDYGQGNVNITLGSGANNVIVASHTGGDSLLGHASITFAAHSVGTADGVTVGSTSDANSTPTGYTVITGLNSSSTATDHIHFSADSSATGAVNVITSAVVSGDVTNIDNWFTAAETAAGVSNHTVEAFAFGNATYLVENSSSAVTIVELVGVTVTAHSSAAAGVLTLHG